MAQLPGSSRVNQYTASALQTVFTYDFKIKADDEITVQQNSTTLTLTTDYTVTDAGEEAGGTIVLVTGAALNDIITLTGNSMVERETTFSNGGDFAAAAINGEYNNILDMLSENVTEIDKTVRLRVYDASFDTTIPTPESRRALMINTAGDGFEMSTSDPDVGSAAAAVSAAAAAASAVEASGYAADASDQVALAAAQVTLAEDQVDLAAAQVTLAEGFADDAEQSAIDAAASAASVDFSAVGQDILPDVNDTRNLGSSTFRWKEIFCTDLTVYDDIKVTDSLTMYGGDLSILSGHTLTVDGLSSLNGGIAVNTNKFTVDSATGNTIVAGTLTVGGSTVGSKAAQYDYHVAYNVNGGAVGSASAWLTRPLNTEVFDTIGASLASNRVTLPAGTYTAVASCSAYDTDYTWYRIYDYTNSAVLGVGATDYVLAAENQGGCTAAFTLAASAAIEVQMMATAVAGAGMGYAHGTAAAGDNYYCSLLITKIA